MFDRLASILFSAPLTLLLDFFYILKLSKVLNLVRNLRQANFLKYVWVVFIVFPFSPSTNTWGIGLC